MMFCEDRLLCLADGVFVALDFSWFSWIATMFVYSLVRVPFVHHTTQSVTNSGR
jgi:hypothetical protein